MSDLKCNFALSSVLNYLTLLYNLHRLPHNNRLHSSQKNKTTSSSCVSRRNYALLRKAFSFYLHNSLFNCIFVLWKKQRKHFQHIEN